MNRFLLWVEYFVWRFHNPPSFTPVSYLLESVTSVGLVLGVVTMYVMVLSGVGMVQVVYCGVFCGLLVGVHFVYSDEIRVAFENVFSYVVYTGVVFVGATGVGFVLGTLLILLSEGVFEQVISFELSRESVSSIGSLDPSYFLLHNIPLALICGIVFPFGLAVIFSTGFQGGVLLSTFFVASEFVGGLLLILPHGVIELFAIIVFGGVGWEYFSRLDGMSSVEDSGGSFDFDARLEHIEESVLRERDWFWGVSVVLYFYAFYRLFWQGLIGESEGSVEVSGVDWRALVCSGFWWVVESRLLRENLVLAAYLVLLLSVAAFVESHLTLWIVDWLIGVELV